MNKFLICSLLLILVFTNSYAHNFSDSNSIQADCYDQNKENNFYAKIFCGTNSLQKKGFDKCPLGYVVSGALGYHFDYGLRLEAEYAFRKNPIYQICFFRRCSFKYAKTSSYMANLLWDLPLVSFVNKWKIQPFVGAGIGCDVGRYGGGYFSWQILSGLRYPIGPNIDISLEYRVHRGVSIYRSFPQAYKHSVGVGLSYKFG